MPVLRHALPGRAHRPSLTTVAVVGVGAEGAGDDAAGLEAARRLHALRPDLKVAALADPIALVTECAGVERLVIVDAARGLGNPGTVARVALGAVRHAFAHASTHGFGLLDALAVARSMGSAPLEVEVYGIEGRSFAAAEPLTPVVRRAAAGLARRLAAEIPNQMDHGADPVRRRA